MGSRGSGQGLHYWEQRLPGMEAILQFCWGQSLQSAVRYRPGKEGGASVTQVRDTEVQQGGGAHSESQGEGGSVEKSGTDLVSCSVA